MIANWKCAIRSAVAEFDEAQDLTPNQKLICAAYFSITKAVKDEYRSDPEYYDVILADEENIEILFNNSCSVIDENVLPEWRRLGFPKELFDRAKSIREADMKRIRSVKEIQIRPEAKDLEGSETIPRHIDESYASFKKVFGRCSFLETWERMPKFLEKEFSVAVKNGTEQIPLFKGESPIARQFYFDCDEPEKKEFVVRKDDGRYWGIVLCSFLVSKNLRRIPDDVVAMIKKMLVDKYGKTVLRERHLVVPLYGATLAAMIYQKTDPESATLKDLSREMLEKAFWFVESCSTEALLFGCIPVESKNMRIMISGDCSPDYWSSVPLSEERKKRREEIQKELSDFFPGLKAARKASRNYVSL